MTTSNRLPEVGDILILTYPWDPTVPRRAGIVATDPDENGRFDVVIAAIAHRGREGGTTVSSCNVNEYNFSWRFKE